MKANISYRELRQLIRQANPHPKSARHTYGDDDIATAYLWAELHRQPAYWAATRRAYPPGCRFDPPSSSLISRRLRTVPVIELIARVRPAMADEIPASPMKLLDSRPLMVGNASNDRDATRGHGAGGKARGYKLGVISCAGLIRDWSFSGMNTNDQTLAAPLIARLGKTGQHLGKTGQHGWGYVVADNGFDGNPLHIAAGAAGHVLVAPPRRSNRGVRDARRNSPERMRALDLSDSPLRHAGIRETMGDGLMRARVGIEHQLGHAAMLGLGPLPPWVRTPHRVALHIEAQLIFHTHRVLEIRRMREKESQQQTI
jgi:hypothetical protein